MTLVPELYCDDIYAITPEYIKGKGICAVILDIDNTLVPYEIAEPTPEVRAWLQALTDNGIKVAFVSNNHAERVELFNRTLGLDAYPESHKPKRGTLETAMKRMGVTHAETAMLGDQLLTDAYAGKHIGLVAIIVPPIKDKTTLFFRAKRWMERPFIRRYARMHGYAAWMSFWKIKQTGGKQ